MNAPIKTNTTWAEELAKEVSGLPTSQFLTFFTELARRLNERAESGDIKERPVMEAIAEHLDDIDDVLHMEFGH